MPKRRYIRSKKAASIRNVSQVEAQRIRNELQLQRAATSSEQNIVANAPGATNASLSTLSLLEQSSDPANPSNGVGILWLSDGTDSGDAGDILVKVTVAGETRSAILFNFSSNTIAIGTMFAASFKRFDLEFAAFLEQDDELFEMALGDLI